MAITAALAAMLMAAAPGQAVEQVDVAFEQLASGQNEAAIREINANSELDQDDPARLINLGVAHARQGETEKARAMFRAALYAEDRQQLETGDGEWSDSRNLARAALAALERGEFEQSTRMAAR